MLFAHPPAKLTTSYTWHRTQACAREKASRKRSDKSSKEMFASLAAIAVCVTFLLSARAAGAQEVVHFPSLDNNGQGQPTTMLDGYLFRPAGEGRHPAI